MYLSILKTLKTMYWNNFSNSKYKSSRTIPSVILQLIAEYSTGQILQCEECDKETEVLIMNDHTIYSSNDEFAPIICPGNQCDEVMFCCTKGHEDVNECRACGDYFCEYCIGQCCYEHPCCFECLLTCGVCCNINQDGDGVCPSCNGDAIDDNFGSGAIWICDGCKGTFCGACALFDTCKKCWNEYCNQCHSDWYCTNSGYCTNSICMDCNKNGMNKCKGCKKKYCQDCVETCGKCGKYYCDHCNKSSDKMCTRCIKKSKKSEKSKKKKSK